MIEAKQLVKKYGTFTAVNGVSFEVNQGEVFGLLGPNGAGKTTTMEMIEGLRRPDGGTAIVCGYDTQTDLRRVKEVIGVQLQSTSLFDLLRVKEIIQMYAGFYANTLEIDPLLERMILTEKSQDRIKNLSGGQKQRLAIALALVHDPKVIFLDEPTTGLDPQARRTLWDIVLSLKNEGKTIVLSTHYMEEAHVLCDRICLMDRGQVVALDTPDALIRQLQFDNAIEFRLGEGSAFSSAGKDHEELERLLTLLRSVDEVKQVEVRNDTYLLYTDDLQKALTSWIASAATNHVFFTDLQTRTATLEDVFIHMTGRSLREA